MYTHTHTHTHTHTQCQHFQSTYTRKHCVSPQPYDNTVYATVKFTKHSISSHTDIMIFMSKHKKKNRHLPGTLFAALQSRFPHMLLEMSAFKTQQWLSEKSYPFQVRTEMMRNLPSQSSNQWFIHGYGEVYPPKRCVKKLHGSKK